MRLCLVSTLHFPDIFVVDASTRLVVSLLQRSSPISAITTKHGCTRARAALVVVKADCRSNPSSWSLLDAITTALLCFCFIPTLFPRLVQKSTSFDYFKPHFLDYPVPLVRTVTFIRKSKVIFVLSCKKQLRTLVALASLINGLFQFGCRKQVNHVCENEFTFVHTTFFLLPLYSQEREMLLVKLGLCF